MVRNVSDQDIRVFIERYAGEYPSQISLIQAAVRVLWPDGPPTGAAEQVVRVCLGGAPRAPSAQLLPASNTSTA